jgi:hypothetical protein
LFVKAEPQKTINAGLTERDANIQHQPLADDQNENHLETMKLQELRSALKEKGLSVKGDKQLLKERLRRASLSETAEDVE